MSGESGDDECCAVNKGKPSDDAERSKSAGGRIKRSVMILNASAANAVQAACAELAR